MALVPMVVEQTSRGERSFDEMIADIENGVFITQMMGQHAGVNAVSGAFNLQASGYRIENGKIVLEKNGKRMTSADPENRKPLQHFH